MTENARWDCARRCLKKMPKEWSANAQLIFSKTCGNCAFCSCALSYKTRGFTTPPKLGQWQIVPFISPERCPQHEELDTLENMFACCYQCNLAEFNRLDLSQAIHHTAMRPKGFVPHPQVVLHVADLLNVRQPLPLLTSSEELAIVTSITSQSPAEAPLKEISWAALSPAAHSSRSGGFGTVGKYTWEPNGQTVAVKAALPGVNGAQYKLLREIAILSKLNHPNIVHLLGYTRNETALCMVLEWIPQTLNDQLPSHDDLDFFKLSLDILHGLRFLHSSGVGHRDVKPSNILLTRRNDVTTAVLCDFGVSRSELSSDELMKTRVGTASFIAPEIRSGSYDLSVDLFSWAKTFEHVLDHNGKHKAIRRIKEADLEAFGAIMLRARKSPDKRISMEEAIKQVQDLYLKYNPAVQPKPSQPSAAPSADAQAPTPATAHVEQQSTPVKLERPSNNSVQSPVIVTNGTFAFGSATSFNTALKPSANASSSSPFAFPAARDNHVGDSAATPLVKLAPIFGGFKAAAAPSAQPSTPPSSPFAQAYGFARTPSNASSAAPTTTPAPTGLFGGYSPSPQSKASPSAPSSTPPPMLQTQTPPYTPSSKASPSSATSTFMSGASSSATEDYSPSYPSSPYEKSFYQTSHAQSFASKPVPASQAQQGDFVYKGVAYVYSDASLQSGDLVEYEDDVYYFKLNGSSCLLFHSMQDFGDYSKKARAPAKTSVRKVVAISPSKAPYTPSSPAAPTHAYGGYVDSSAEPVRGDLVSYEGNYYFFQPNGSSCYLYKRACDVGEKHLAEYSPTKAKVRKVVAATRSR